MAQETFYTVLVSNTSHEIATLHACCPLLVFILTSPIYVMQKLPERVIQRVSHCTFILKIGKWNADAQQGDLSKLPY